MRKKRKTGPQKVETLCWTCANAVPDGERGCSWSIDLIPVSGWTAEKRGNREFDTYRVKACPLYVKDTPEEQEAQTERMRANLEEMAEETKNRAGRQQGRHWVDHYWNNEPGGVPDDISGYWLRDGM